MDTEKKNEIPVIAICGEDIGVRTREGDCATVCCCSNWQLSHAGTLVCEGFNYRLCEGVYVLGLGRVGVNRD